MQNENVVIRTFDKNSIGYTNIVVVKKSDLENAILALDVLNGQNK